MGGYLLSMKDPTALSSRAEGIRGHSKGQTTLPLRMTQAMVEQQGCTVLVQLSAEAEHDYMAKQAQPS